MYIYDTDSPRPLLPQVAQAGLRPRREGLARGSYYHWYYYYRYDWLSLVLSYYYCQYEYYQYEYYHIITVNMSITIY